jgi:hypothetical protein
MGPQGPAGADGVDGVDGAQGPQGEPGGIAFMRSGTFVMPANTSSYTVVFSSALPISDFAAVVNIVQDQDGVTSSPHPFYVSIEGRSSNGFSIVLRSNTNGALVPVTGTTTFYYVALPYQ